MKNSFVICSAVAILMLVGCDNSKNAILEVLKQRQRAGIAEMSTAIEVAKSGDPTPLLKLADRLDSIDLSECPSDFAEAFTKSRIRFRRWIETGIDVHNRGEKPSDLSAVDTVKAAYEDAKEEVDTLAARYGVLLQSDP